MHQALDKLHREVESNRELFLKLRKDYDRYTIHENLFVRNKDTYVDYKTYVKKRLEALAERHFSELFPQQHKSKQPLIQQVEF